MQNPGMRYESAPMSGAFEYGSLIPDDFNEVARWSRYNAPPQDSAAGADWNHWRPTPVLPGEVPYPMLRVGVPRGPDKRNMVMMGGLGEAHTSMEDSEEARGVVQGMILRTLGSTMPGTVHLKVYDGNFKATFLDFGDLASVRSPLTGNRLLEHIPSNELEAALSGIMRFQERLNAGEIKQAGTLEHPWQVLVMLGDADLSDRGRSYLNRLINAGVGWGMFLGVGVKGLVGDPSLLQPGSPEPIPPRYDPAPPRPLVKKTVGQIVDAMKRGATKVPPAHEYYTGKEVLSTAECIEVDMGVAPDGSRVTLRFDDKTPHGLLEGPSGFGKTNTLLSMISSLANYDPDELDLRIVDGKFAGMAILDRSADGSDKAFLPQATQLGLNVTDPEDWLAILRDLDAEMDRRKTLLGDYRVGEFKDLRGVMARRHPGEKLPRVLLIWDEVQELFESEAGNEAVDIITRLATMGRQMGIHMLLATVEMHKMNNVSVQQTGLLQRFLLRLATAGANSVLDPLTHRNFMPLIPQHAVAVNTNGGKYTAGNQIARVPHASVASVRAVKTAAWQKWGSKVKPPAVLDGRMIPDVRDAPQYGSLRPSDDHWPVGLVGQEPGAAGYAAEFQFNRAPGRNIAVIGSRPREIAQVFGSLAETIPKQYRPGQAKFTVLCRNPELVDAANQVIAHLKAAGHAVSVYTDKTAVPMLGELAREVRSAEGYDNASDHYLFVYGANGLNSKDFSTIINEGPERGTHVVASWSSLDRLKGSLGYTSPSDAVEGHVLLNVTPDEVQRMTDSFKHTWGSSERPGRALFGDIRSGKLSRVVKLYS